MFLQGSEDNHVTDIDNLERSSMKSIWSYILKVRDGLTSRLKKEYLGVLRSNQNNRLDLIHSRRCSTSAQ